MKQRFIAVIIAVTLFTAFSCRTTVDMEKRSEAIKADGKSDVSAHASSAPVPEKEIVYVEAPNVIRGEVNREPGAMLEAMRSKNI